MVRATLTSSTFTGLIGLPEKNVIVVANYCEGSKIAVDYNAGNKP